MCKPTGDESYRINQSPEEIWLEPQCAEAGYEGRSWCPEDTWDHCEDCLSPSVKYIREDLVLKRVGE